MKKNVYLIFLLIFSLNQSQIRKSIEAYRFTNPPKIDGKLDDIEWQNIKAAKNFTFIRPETKAGEKLPDDYKSKVYLGY